MIDVLWDMETADPDDVFTLCLLASHPAVNLRAVTVTPGTRAQIGIAKYILQLLGRTDVVLGSRDVNRDKQCVSSFHYFWLGNVPPAEPDGEAHEVLAAVLGKYPDATVVTGAPLGNIGALLTQHEVQIKTLVIQGGFAGDPVVPPEWRLEKFSGKVTCPTYNLNGDPVSAQLAIASPKVLQRFCVSKNVCHGVVYDQEMHERIILLQDNYPGLKLIVEGMGRYLRKHPDGKKFHDPLAACAAIDRSVCEFREVELYRERGQWGSRLASGTNTHISVRVDRERFEQVLTGTTRAA